jgi:hypothetical protein
VVLGSLLAFSLAAPAGATGLMECEGADPEQWQSKEALQAKLEAEGWTKVKKIKVDGGCYEAYATTPEGDKVEAYFHPVTLEKLLVARRGIILFKKRVLYEKGEPGQEGQEG